jgi:hypothetical protein
MNQTTSSKLTSIEVGKMIQLVVMAADFYSKKGFANAFTLIQLS